MRGVRAFLALCCALIASPAGAKPVLVFAAASLQGALDDVADSYAAQGHARPLISYAGSAILARQIIAGAPADIYISADNQWMTALVTVRKVQARTVRGFVGNQLVLVAPRTASLSFKLKRGAKLGAVLGKRKLAMGDPQSVPAGGYAKAGLIYYGLWPQVQNNLVTTDNVRQALMLAERGDVAMAIVYASDAKSSAKLRIVDMFPPQSHPPIIYPAALVSGEMRDEARGFLAYLWSPRAQQILRAHGFTPLEGAK